MNLVRIDDPVEQWEAMTAVAKVADGGSWDSIWLYDHFHTVPEPTRNTVFECWTTTAALARDTQRVNIGQMVGCNGYRNPALYAKMASTVDVASHGRLYAGIGAGWYEHEWKAYGYEWTDTGPRMAAFREAVEIVYRMWTEDDVVFEGNYHSVDKPINEPKGVRKPHPSLWIGGSGPKVTLKLVAQYADACNFGSGDPERIRRSLSTLREHCETVGRDYESIIKSTSVNVFPIDPGDDPEKATARARGPLDLDEFTEIGAAGGVVGGRTQVVDTDRLGSWIEQLAEAGIEYVIADVPGVVHDHDPLMRLDEVVTPRFA
jgi:F420-dependent oxidoreductase-like protein